MIDFPSNPVNGQIYANYVYDSAITAWRNLNTETGFSTLNMTGLKCVIPTSLSKGASGTATTNANGLVVFSGTESIALNGVFTSQYLNYKVIITHDGGSVDSSTTNFKFRTGLTDRTGGYYYSGWRTNAIDGTSGIWNGNNTNSIHYGYDRNTLTNHAIASMDIGRPFESRQSSVTLLSENYSGSAFSNLFLGAVASTNESHDGISFSYSSGLHSGTISVYGYNN